MKKLLYLSLLFILSCCHTTKDVPSIQDEYGNDMFEQEYSLSKMQFDSLCISDTLPNDLDKWEKMYIRNAITRKGEALYLYIKKLGKQQSIYRAEKMSNDSVYITKRTTE